MFFELRRQDGSKWIVKPVLGELLFADPKSKTFSFIEAYLQNQPEPRNFHSGPKGL